MRTLMYQFIHNCDSVGITPNEKHIEAFLRQNDKLDLNENFIKFCFYNWEDRKNEKKIESLFNIV